MHDELAAFLKTAGNFIHIELPRGHLKSWIVTKGWAIQQVLKNPNLRVLIVNAVEGNATMFLRTIEKFMGPGSGLEVIYGSFVSDVWNQNELIIRQRTQVLDAPTFAAAGVQKTLTSQHYDIIIADDLVEPANVATPEQRAKIYEFYLSLFDLLEPQGKLVVIGTRYHQADLYSKILEENDDKHNWSTFIRSCYNDDGSVLFPEKFTKERLENIRSKPGGRYHFACTPAETPILMADWKTKPIEHVKVGDEIVGFTRAESGRRKLVNARVKRTFSKQDHVLSLIMKSGRKVLCTKDHRWYTSRSDASHKEYAPAQIGTKLNFVCDVGHRVFSEKEQMDWSYLAGMFDGEGSTKSGGTLTLTQCSSVNPDVHRNIGEVLNRLKINYGTHVRKQELAARNQSPGNTIFWLKDSLNVGLNLIRYTRCAKAGQIADRFMRYGARFVKEKDEVVDVKYDSFRTVYALETETGNYVAWGYASSNSQYMNNPIDEESADFKASWIKHYDPTTPHPGSLYLTIDPAISLSRDADFSALVVAGMFSDRRIRVVDSIHRRMVPSDLVDAIFELVKKWRLHRVGIETFAFQQTLKYDVQRKQRESGVFFSIDELGKRHSGRGEQVLSKEARIRRLQPYFEQGLVEIRSDMSELADELLAFPRGRHDDLIDALSYQLDYLVPSMQKSAPPLDAVHGSMGWWVKQLPQPTLSIYDRFLQDIQR